MMKEMFTFVLHIMVFLSRKIDLCISSYHKRRLGGIAEDTSFLKPDAIVGHHKIFIGRNTYFF